MQLGLGQMISKSLRKGIGASVSLYQQWASYPDSPVLTTDYPFQYIWISGGNSFLLYSVFESYKDGTTWMRTIGITPKVVYAKQFSGGVWIDAGNYTDQWNMGTANPDIPERNYDIYADSAKTTIKYAKTTA